MRAVVHKLVCLNICTCWVICQLCFSVEARRLSWNYRGHCCLTATRTRMTLQRTDHRFYNGEHHQRNRRRKCKLHPFNPSLEHWPYKQSWTGLFMSPRCVIFVRVRQHAVRAECNSDLHRFPRHSIANSARHTASDKYLLIMAPKKLLIDTDPGVGSHFILQL